MDRTLDPGLIARFAAETDRLLPQGGRLGLAVSGGPDSLGLLLLAHAAMPDRIEAATVDHGLRTGAADEARMVAQLCASLGVPHRIMAVQVANGNVQEEARLARYAALSHWLESRGLVALATAHHADDQAETLLMRLNRGSGVAGLAGVRVAGIVPGGTLPLLRPVLGWRRADLAHIVEYAGITAAQDPSNLDEKFDRVRVRKALVGADWLNPDSLVASAAHLADADEALSWAAEREWAEQVRAVAGGYRYAPLAPKAIRLRVVARIIAELGGQPRGGAVARLVMSLQQGGTGTLAGVVANAAGGMWHFQPEPPRA